MRQYIKMVQNAQYHQSKMFSKIVVYSILASTVFVYAEAQNVPESLESSPKLQKRPTIFSNVFLERVKSSPQLLRVFDVSTPSSEISTNIFYTFQEAMQKIDTQYPESLAKSLADAMYLSLPAMSQEAYVFVIARSVALYLLSQEILTVNNSATKAQKFADVILENYPKKGDVSNLALARTLSNGIVDYLISHGTVKVEHVSAFGISVSKYFFAFSLATKPPLEVSVVAPPDTIPGVNRIYGVFPFAKAFINAIESSAALQSVFFSTEPVSVIATSWQSALDLFCSSISCYFPKAYKIHFYVSETYDYLSKSTYAKQIAEAFAILMVGMGTLSPDSAETEGHKVATLIEGLVNSLPSDANLQMKYGTVLEAFKSLVGTNHDIRFQYPAFVHHMAIGFYSASPVAASMNQL